MKVWAYLAIAVVVIGGLKWAYTSIYDAGWNAAVIEYEHRIAIAKDQAVAKARQQWENLTERAEAEIVIEEKIVERVRVVEKEIPTIVERIVEVTPECNDLGADFARLLNDQVNSGAGGRVPDTSITSEPDT